MFKIFSKIRQRLLSESKFSNYLVYALGEIILVVIGILIAFSINNWNTKRNDRIFEIKMLREMDKALRQDYIFFTDHLIGYRTKTELRAIAFFDRMIISNTVVKDSVDFHFKRLDFGLQISFNRGPYDALKSSGIDRISNDELRNKLIHFYDFFLSRYQRLAEWKRESSSAKMIPLIDQLSTPAPLSISEDSVIRTGLILKEIDFHNDENFNQLIYTTKERALFIENILETITPEMLELSNMLSKEIEK